MARLHKIVFCWLITAAWMCLIFKASGDLMSSQETSQYLKPLLQWVFPGISEHNLSSMMFIIRKGGHLTEYAVLAILSFASVRVVRVESARVPFLPNALWAWGIATAYAVTDEIHQWFVPSRCGAWQDVVIDSLGAFAGLCVLWLAGWLVNAWKARRGTDAPPPQAAETRSSG